MSGTFLDHFNVGSLSILFISILDVINRIHWDAYD
jgi:hypothetical protein